MKSEEATSLIKDLQQEKRVLVYLICVIQGLLQSKQTLACSGLQKFFPWSLQSLISGLVAISDFESNNMRELPQYLIKVIIYFFTIYHILLYNYIKKNIRMFIQIFWMMILIESIYITLLN